MRNVLTIDVEDWFHANYDRTPSPVAAEKSTVRSNVERLLAILDEYDAKATFFVLGAVAEADARLVKDIQQRGHEIASHGFGHQLVYLQTRDEFRSDVVRSLDLLRHITGTAVIGYRAPSWSIRRNSSWAFEELWSVGVKYDSSIFPMKTFLYGDSQAPRFTYRIGLSRGRELVEIPPSTLRAFSRRFAFSGGFYLRLLPYWLIKLATKWINAREKQPVVFYLHPREIDAYQPRLALSRRDEFVHYVNLRSTEAKLRRLLRDFPVVGIQESFSSSGGFCE